MIPGRSDIASSRGLKWNKLTAQLMGVDIFAPVSPAPDPEDVERRMDSPTGPSMYVTRDCIERIGLMDESFFLYWEEVDWAMRAKAACGIGYAHNSVVPHISGSSTGAVEGSREAIGLFGLFEQPQSSFISFAEHHPRWFHGRCSCPSSEADNILRPDRRGISPPRSGVCSPACAERLGARRLLRPRRPSESERRFAFSSASAARC